MVRTAHSADSANVNLAYALIDANHVKRARDLVERQNLYVDERMLQYFTTVASTQENPRLLKDLFIVFNGRTSTLELNKLLELATKKMYGKNDMESLEELSKEIDSTSFPLQHKLRTFFEDFKRKQTESVEFD
uniref:Uncharacterized protein n=1 Tax=Caenorhabditis japonica TaxID=281687 RepID=A0A8R1J1B7_CAEJA